MNKKLQRLTLLGAATLAAGLLGCSSEKTPAPDPFAPRTVRMGTFGRMADGREVKIFTLRNSKGMEARVSTFGGVLVSLTVPDRNGQLGDVVLGYDTLSEYVNNPVTYYGALIGRYANRIGGAKFSLDGKTYQLDPNNNGNTLHGGSHGFWNVLWDGSVNDSSQGASVKLHLTSRDGDGGYPGTLNVTAIYTLTENNELHLDFTATTDKATVVNLTSHTFWKLQTGSTVLDEVLTIPSSKITPVDAGLIPTGAFLDVAGTPFDFRQPTAIGARINDTNPQLLLGPGYDHNYVFDKKTGDLTMMARLEDPGNGRVMEVWSTEPAIQLYSGNFIDGTIKGKRGVAAVKHGALCLEPQHYPDSPNKPLFPSTELRPGETYHHSIVYKFSTK